METDVISVYRAIKRQPRFAARVLLLRVGDFLEAMDDDARRVAEVCQMTVTRREYRGTSASMVGFPAASMSIYARSLKEAGVLFSVASFADGVVRMPSRPARNQRCACPLRCKYCGARRRRDLVGHYCPTSNCQWRHGFHTCEVIAITPLEE